MTFLESFLEKSTFTLQEVQDCWEPRGNDPERTTCDQSSKTRWDIDGTLQTVPVVMGNAVFLGRPIENFKMY